MVVSRSPNEKGGVVVGILKLELVAVGVDLKFARIGLALEGNGVSELSNGARLVLPADAERRLRLNVSDIRRQGSRLHATHQMAEVARGMRSSSGMTDSSKGILESFPGASLCSTEWAKTVEMSTSPPK